MMCRSSTTTARSPLASRPASTHVISTNGKQQLAATAYARLRSLLPPLPTAQPQLVDYVRETCARIGTDEQVCLPVVTRVLGTAGGDALSLLLQQRRVQIDVRPSRRPTSVFFGLSLAPPDDAPTWLWSNSCLVSGASASADSSDADSDSAMVHVVFVLDAVAWTFAVSDWVSTLRRLNVQMVLCAPTATPSGTVRQAFRAHGLHVVDDVVIGDALRVLTALNALPLDTPHDLEADKAAVCSMRLYVRPDRLLFALPHLADVLPPTDPAVWPTLHVHAGARCAAAAAALRRALYELLHGAAALRRSDGGLWDVCAVARALLTRGTAAAPPATAAAAPVPPPPLVGAPRASLVSGPAAALAAVRPEGTASRDAGDPDVPMCGLARTGRRWRTLSAPQRAGCERFLLNAEPLLASLSNIPELLPDSAGGVPVLTCAPVRWWSAQPLRVLARAASVAAAELRSVRRSGALVSGLWRSVGASADASDGSIALDALDGDPDDDSEREWWDQ